jgi:organic hydroperoxide reductase OsmC/OhrA
MEINIICGGPHNPREHRHFPDCSRRLVRGRDLRYETSMPSSRESIFTTRVRWTGGYVSGQSGARSYTRDMFVEPDGKPPILGSAGARYFGDDTRYNPEDLMLASLAECHLLTYLALATKAGIRLTALAVQVSGTLGNVDGKTRFLRAQLSAQTSIALGNDPERARALHTDAHEQCFMSNSVNFPIDIDAAVSVGP